MTKYGSDPDHFYVQTNNAVEYIIRAIKAEMAGKLLKAGVSQATLDLVHAKGYLESCGMDAVCNACGALIEMPTVQLKFSDGTTKPIDKWVQLDDIAMMFINNPKNSALVQAILGAIFDGSEVMENRYMQLHPMVAAMLFGVRAEYKQGRNFDEIWNAVDAGNSAGLLTPGHYVAAVNPGPDKDTLIINDSWHGFNLKLSRADFATVTQTVVYYKP